jgi:hypothetical protein
LVAPTRRATLTTRINTDTATLSIKVHHFGAATLAIRLPTGSEKINAISKSHPLFKRTVESRLKSAFEKKRALKKDFIFEKSSK